MNQSPNRNESPYNPNETEDAEGLKQNKWTLFGTEDSSSSSSSVPTNLNLIDGDIEIIQHNKSLAEDDKLFPGTALHKIKFSDRDRKLLTKCSAVSTDWAFELESSFVKGSQRLLRKVVTGSQFSHSYDNQGAFDVVVIRAHLTAKSGKTNFDGYFFRRQKLSSPIEQSQAFKQLAATRRNRGNSHFKKLSDSSAPSLSEIEELKAGGDFRKSNDFLSERPVMNSGIETIFRSNANLPLEGIPGLLSASADNEPIRTERFNGGSNVKGALEEASADSAQTSSKATKPSDETAHEKPTFDLPDPKNVPRAVIDVQDFDDVLANKKVIDYLNHLEEGAGLIYNHLDNNMGVSEEEIESVNSATSAILREYGYDFPDPTRAKKRNETDTSSESDVSDSELKSEVVKRAMDGRDFSGLLDLLKNSKEWKESLKDDWTSGSGRSGKIERKIHQTYKSSKNK